MLAIECTDTFGGEANYCWVKRWFCKAELTDAQAIKLAKRLCGFTGHRCRKDEWSDTMALYPAGVCQVVFISYTEGPFGSEVDAKGNLVSEGVEA